MLFLTRDQHKSVLRRLTTLGERVEGGVRINHPELCLPYTSLMVSLLLHQLSAGETLLRMSVAFSDEWFPVAVGYTIVRGMLEVDITAHYISQSPTERAQQYIDFAAVISKNAMDACRKHRSSRKPDWQEAMDLLWRGHWSQRENEVQRSFDAVADKFTRSNKSGKKSQFSNWAGKTLRDLAVEVDHEEAYDVFYAELSSFSHADVHLADRYLKLRPDGPVWSQKAEDGDVGQVFRNAASFLACNLELFGDKFGTWTKDEVQACWNLDSSESRMRNLSEARQ